MKPPIPPLCTLCEYWQPGAEQPDDVNRCQAFPNGIPQKIWSSEVDHRVAVGNESTVFEKREGVKDSQVEAWAEARIKFGAAVLSVEAGVDPLPPDDLQSGGGPIDE